MLKKVSKVVLLILILGVVTFNLEARGEFPLRVIDDLNREVVVEDRPERIISLAPNITEILYELGLEDRVVGVSEVCDYPKEVEDKKRVSHDSLESVLALNPDVVIAAGITPTEVIDRLEELGIVVLGFHPEDIGETLESIERIASVVGLIQRGNELRDELESEFEYISTEVGEAVQLEGRVKVFYEVWNDPLYTAGKNTFIHDLILKAGGENIGAKATGKWPQYNKEMLLVEDPQVYIATYDSWSEDISLDSIKERVGYSQISAINDGRVHIFDANIINRPGPRVIEALKLFVGAIQPDIDLED